MLVVDGELRLQIEDDGTGLSVDPLTAASGGLRNLQARAESVGGRVEWSLGEPGTRLLFTAPLEEALAKAREA